MYSVNKAYISFAFVWALCSCAGTDFVRPDPGSLRNGETTYAQTIQRLGKPFTEGTMVKNDQTIKTLSYTYASVGGKPLHGGALAVRGLHLFFYNDVLVGHEFVSSWSEDNTDFDESKVGQIAKGKTTRSELVQLLGKQSGHFIYPMIKSKEGDAAVYLFVEVQGGAFNRKFFRKTLVVTFDSNGVVSDVEFSSSGSS
jgi:hypothetical protein